MIELTGSRRSTIWSNTSYKAGRVIFSKTFIIVHLNRILNALSLPIFSEDKYFTSYIADVVKQYVRDCYQHDFPPDIQNLAKTVPPILSLVFMRNPELIQSPSTIECLFDEILITEGPEYCAKYNISDLYAALTKS